MSLDSHKDLMVWQKGRTLVKDVYNICAELPLDEKYGLSSQMKRAVVSIPSNIAEGYRRNNRKEYVQFLGIAAGSAAELETQLILANDLFGLANSAQLSLLEEVQKMLSKLISTLRP